MDTSQAITTTVTCSWCGFGIRTTYGSVTKEEAHEKTSNELFKASWRDVVVKEGPGTAEWTDSTLCPECAQALDDLRKSRPDASAK
jgi:hypothetical protein